MPDSSFFDTTDNARNSQLVFLLKQNKNYIFTRINSSLIRCTIDQIIRSLHFVFFSTARLTPSSFKMSKRSFSFQFDQASKSANVTAQRDSRVSTKLSRGRFAALVGKGAADRDDSVANADERGVRNARPKNIRDTSTRESYFVLLVWFLDR